VANSGQSRKIIVILIILFQVKRCQNNKTIPITLLFFVSGKMSTVILSQRLRASWIRMSVELSSFRWQLYDLC